MCSSGAWPLGAFSVGRESAAPVVERFDLTGDGEYSFGGCAVGDAGVDESSRRRGSDTTGHRRRRSGPRRPHDRRPPRPCQPGEIRSRAYRPRRRLRRRPQAQPTEPNRGRSSWWILDGRPADCHLAVRWPLSWDVVEPTVGVELTSYALRVVGVLLVFSSGLREVGSHRKPVIE